MKRFSFKNFLFNVMFGLLLAMFTPLPAAAAIGLTLAGGTTMSFIPQSTVLRAGVAKEIWTDQIMEGFYPKDDFLAWSRDMSSLVEYNQLNLAEAGADPLLLIDNTDYPITSAVRTDVPKTIALRTLDTNSTIVRNLEALEASYDKRESVLRGHRNVLRKGSVQLAAHYWAPQSNGTYTPVLATTGAVINSRKRLQFEDVLELRSKLLALDADLSSFAMCLHPLHEGDLMAQDMKLYKEMMANGKLWEFTYFVNSQVPRFNASTGAKVAFQAAAAGTDTVATIFWSRDEVMRADGTVEMFAKFKDPDQKGDVFNFQKRFVALPFRNKLQGAIYSPQS